MPEPVHATVMPSFDKKDVDDNKLGTSVGIIALIKCLMGEFWEIPVIGPLRSKINL